MRRALCAIAVLGVAGVVCAAPIGATTGRPRSSAAAPCSVPALPAGWTLTRLAEQTVVVPVDQGALAAARPEVAGGAGGLLLTGSSPGALGRDLAALDTAAPRGLLPLVMADEEGGAVQRLEAVVGALPSARQMGATLGPGAISALARRVGVKMAALGVHMDIAPVLDADGGRGPSATDPDGTRSFSADPVTASADGIAFATGLLRAGVLPVVKHFPGLGGSSGNTDFEAATTLPWSRLETTGAEPFANAVRAGLPAVMVADAVVPGLTTVPAAVSPIAVTRELDDRLGFAGLVLSDSLSVPALQSSGYRLDAAAVDALRAGVDMVLFDSTTARLLATTAGVVVAITAAVRSGVLPRPRLVAAATAVLAAKRAVMCPAR